MFEMEGDKMGIIDEEKYYAKKEKILNFIIENSQNYADINVTFWLMKEIITDNVLKTNVQKMPATMSQILSKFGVYKEGKDEYEELCKLLEQYSFLEGNVCEVSAGRYPRLAELTAPKIKTRKGTLTIYEPNIILNNMANITIVKDKFTKSTDIAKFDTLYALYPCETTIPIIEKAYEEDKNLMLAFCGCNHSTNSKHKKWIENIGQ